MLVLSSKFCSLFHCRFLMLILLIKYILRERWCYRILIIDVSLYTYIFILILYIYYYTFYIAIYAHFLSFIANTVLVHFKPKDDHSNNLKMVSGRITIIFVIQNKINPFCDSGHVER